MVWTHSQGFILHSCGQILQMAIKYCFNLLIVGASVSSFERNYPRPAVPVVRNRSP